MLSWTLARNDAFTAHGLFVTSLKLARLSFLSVSPSISTIARLPYALLLTSLSSSSSPTYALQ